MSTRAAAAPRKGLAFGLASGILATILGASVARAGEVYDFFGPHHDIDLNATSWSLTGLQPQRVETTAFDADVGADLVVRFASSPTASGKLVAFVEPRLRMTPYVVAASGVTDFAVLSPGRIVFANASGLNVATYDQPNDTFVVTAVSGSSAFANATMLAARGAGTTGSVAALGSNGTSVPWVTLSGSSISSTISFTAPSGVLEVAFARFDAQNPTEIDLVLRTANPTGGLTTISAWDPAAPSTPAISYAGFEPGGVIGIQRGISFDRIHTFAKYGTYRSIVSYDPSQGILAGVDLVGLDVSALTFGDYDGNGVEDLACPLANGTVTLMLYGNAWTSNTPWALNLEEHTFFDLKADASGGKAGFADFEGDGDPDVWYLSAARRVEICANPRVNEDDYLFKVEVSPTSNGTVVDFDMTELVMDPPHGVSTGATHVAVEFFGQTSMSSDVSLTPLQVSFDGNTWRTVALFEIPVPGNGGLVEFDPAAFEVALNGLPSSGVLHVRMQQVSSTNGVTITNRLAPALTANFSFEATVMDALAALPTAWDGIRPPDVDPVKLGDGNQESNINPTPPRP